MDSLHSRVVRPPVTAFALLTLRPSGMLLPLMKNAGLTLATLVPVIAACAPAHPVEFAGVARPPRTDAAAIQSYHVLPEGHHRLGRASVECLGFARGATVRDAPWLSVVCDEGILRKLLRQRAAEVGGTALVRERCVTDNPPEDARSAACAADVAAAPSGGGTSVAKSDSREAAFPFSRGVLSARVDITPVSVVPVRMRVDEPRVREMPQASVDHVEIAAVSARCEACSRNDAELALRSVVGSLGAVAVSDVSCRRSFDGWQCLGDAMVEEREQTELQVW